MREAEQAAGFQIREARPEDRAGAYYVCMKTGNHGGEGEPLYREDPDALGRIYVGPYLELERGPNLVLDDREGICGYAVGAFDSRTFYARYETEWRPLLAARFPPPDGDPAAWTPVQQVHHAYHHPDYFCPEPYDMFPSHLHIDVLPRAQGRGLGRRMLERLMTHLAERGSPGVHLGVSPRNRRALGFYEHLGFRVLARTGTEEEGTVYMGMEFRR